MVEMALATVAIIFLVGAWQKLRDLMAFEIAIEAYELIPTVLVRPLAIALPLLEITAAITLVIVLTRPLGAALALVVLAMVTGAVAINLLRGRTDVGCGCGGLEDEQTLSWALVMRNMLLAIFVVSSFAGAALRALTWLDYFSIAAGAVCFYGLYLLANQLIANQPRLLGLRTSA